MRRSLLEALMAEGVAELAGGRIGNAGGSIAQDAGVEGAVHLGG